MRTAQQDSIRSPCSKHATSAILTACGGTDDANVTERCALPAQSTVWETRMPTVVPPREDLPCISLIVGFSIRSGSSGFPSGISAKSMTLFKPGAQAWETPVSISETGLTTRWVSDSDWVSLVGSADGNRPTGWRTEQVLSGVARGCSTPDFQEGDELLVGVNVDAAGESSMVVSAAKFYAAH